MWTNSVEGLASTTSFSSFADLQSKLDLYANDNFSEDENDQNEYSHETLAISSDNLNTSKLLLPSITPERSQSPYPSIDRSKSPLTASNKTKKEVKSTDTVYLENLKI